MKVVIVNATDAESGSGRAAFRLHQSLLRIDVDSTMIVQLKRGSDQTVLTEESNLAKVCNQLRPSVDKIRLLNYQRKTKQPFSADWLPFSRIPDRINELKPDIVHLHWINGGTLRMKDVERIKAPIVWTLHDTWLFTGGCHYTDGCHAYLNECGQCPAINSNKKRDLSYRSFQRKRAYFSKEKKTAIVGLSRWLEGISKESRILADVPHYNLPNPINTRVFKRVDKSLARDLLNLPHDKVLIAFGANNPTSDKRKGFKQLIEALEGLSNENVELVVFGSGEPKNKLDIGFKINYMGYLKDDFSLVAMYSAVNVMVTPSLEENLSNAIMESLSCELPVVGFDIGGNSDMIVHKKNGYLAKALDSNDLSRGIRWVIENNDNGKLGETARKFVMHNFSESVVAPRYLEMYTQIMRYSQGR